MMRECEDHGYFRDESCPVCGEEGKFLMSDYEVEKIGRTMAGILRHGKFELEMDDQGFVDTRDIVAVVKSRYPKMKWLRTHHIEAMAETDPKGRYQISGSDVRATYGHTIELSLRLPVDNIPEFLYYPTTEEECELLLEDGLFPTDRAMVHLSRSYKDAMKAGLVRSEEPVILVIDTAGCIDAGIEIGKAAKTVFLCDQVPPEFLSIAEAEESEDEEEDYLEEDEED
ncbi:MAG: RNA 2'-phosphotransferase [Candidatus Methanoplasma sp.]|jgi:putative RNA 2'-phosphotransferase|nr:RNA 2'-phosphotransferase [Candidatus Methanoplasma sp.]